MDDSIGRVSNCQSCYKNLLIEKIQQVGLGKSFASQGLHLKQLVFSDSIRWALPHIDSLQVKGTAKLWQMFLCEKVSEGNMHIFLHFPSGYQLWHMLLHIKWTMPGIPQGVVCYLAGKEKVVAKVCSSISNHPPWIWTTVWWTIWEERIWRC